MKVMNYKKYNFRADCPTGYRSIHREDYNFMDDSESRRKFDECLEELDEKFKFWIDLIRESERITEKDLSLIVNY